MTEPDEDDVPVPLWVELVVPFLGVVLGIASVLVMLKVLYRVVHT